MSFYSVALAILIHRSSRTICSSILNVVMQMEKYPRIRNLREDSDLTQQQVGAAINVPQRTYAYYESGQRMVPLHVLCAHSLIFTR